MMRSNDSNFCKTCLTPFSSERSLHAHLKKHKTSIDEYYFTHYPRVNMLTGTLLPFKDKESYFQNDFENRDQLIAWCGIEKDATVKEYIKKLFESRIKNKLLKKGPSQVELLTSLMPSIDIYKKHFGSYAQLCYDVGVPPLFGKCMPKCFNDDYSNIEIFSDTREQKPLNLILVIILLEAGTIPKPL